LTARIFLKLILAVMIVLVVALASADYLVSRVAEENYRSTLIRSMQEKGRLLAAMHGPGFEALSDEQWRELGKAASARLTLVRPDGSVIGDSDASPERMENHSDRPEIRAALRGRRSSATRPSPTLGKEFLYVAVPVSQGALRLAVPMPALRQQVTNIRWRLVTVTALAFLPALLLAGLLARWVSSRLGVIIAYAGRLAAGDFRARLPWSGKDELGVLSNKLNETASALEQTFQKLEGEQREMERLDRVRKDFLINVSHELRTPLASIQGYTETLLDGALHDEQHNIRFLNIIRQNAERLGRLIADLMTISRLELKTEPLQPASYYVNTLLSESFDSMLPLAERKHINLSFEPAPEKAEFFCDAEALHQIMVNLIDNALKYTAEGGAIKITAKVNPPAHNRHEEVEVSVVDTGIGVPDEDQPRLFERFYRVDKARSRELGGTGLGLAIVKHLVQAQGGSLGVQSVLHKGSRFWFTLPVHDLGVDEHSVQPFAASEAET
jgi:two-component system, OmpR family, phosphate regulon sensor histidine kinase PhoR